MQNFRRGWVRQNPDPRDFVFNALLASSLPPWFDNSKNMGPLLNQGRLGACGPFSATECITYDQKIQGLSLVSASELFIYYNTRILMGTVNDDSGVDNRHMLKALNKQGFPPLADLPYADDATTFKQKPSASVYANAMPNLIQNYSTVAQNSTAMQGCLASGRVFLYGFTVYDSMLTDAVDVSGIVPMPPQPDDAVAGGHDVTITGFNASGGDLPGIQPGKHWPNNTYRFRNHWVLADGSPWGDGGYGYMPFAYAHDVRLAGDFWVINAIPGVSPTPTPRTGIARVVLLDANGNMLQSLNVTS